MHPVDFCYVFLGFLGSTNCVGAYATTIRKLRLASNTFPDIETTPQKASHNDIKQTPYSPHHPITHLAPIKRSVLIPLLFPR